MKRKSEIRVCCVVLVMLVACGQAEMTIISQSTIRTNAKTPEIAIKSTGPVVFLQDTGAPYRSSYSENLTSWDGIGSGVSGGDWSGLKALDVQVDSADNVHLAWGRHNIAPGIWWQAQTDGVSWGAEEQVGDQAWGETAGGRVQMQVNGDGVHVGWIPRNTLADQDSNQKVYHYRNRDAGTGVWSNIVEMSNGDQAEIAPKLLASASEVYYLSLEHNAENGGRGPFVQQVGTGDRKSVV